MTRAGHLALSVAHFFGGLITVALFLVAGASLATCGSAVLTAAIIALKTIRPAPDATAPEQRMLLTRVGRPPNPPPGPSDQL